MEQRMRRSLWAPRTGGLAACLLLLQAVVAPVADAQEEPTRSPTPAELLTDFLPRTVGGAEIEVLAVSGREWLETLEDPGADESFREFVALATGDGGQGSLPDLALEANVSLGSGLFENTVGQTSAISAIRVCGADAGDLLRAARRLYSADADSTGDPETSTEPIETGVGEPDGELLQEAVASNVVAVAADGIVWLVNANEPAIEEIIASLRPIEAEQPCVPWTTP